MTRDRLLQLIETYGAWPDRWPEAERDAALGALADAPEAAEALCAAQALDATLDAWRLEALPAAAARRLEARMLAARPNAGRAWVMRTSASLRQPAAWVSGAGLAAACAAGVMVGLQLGAIAVVHAPDPEAASSFADVSGAGLDAPMDGEGSL